MTRYASPLALGLAILAGALMFASGPLYRSGSAPLLTAFTLMRWAAYLGGGGGGARNRRASVGARPAIAGRRGTAHRRDRICDSLPVAAVRAHGSAHSRHHHRHDRPAHL